MHAVNRKVAIDNPSSSLIKISLNINKKHYIECYAKLKITNKGATRKFS